MARKKRDSKNDHTGDGVEVIEPELSGSEARGDSVGASGADSVSPAEDEHEPSGEDDSLHADTLANEVREMRELAQRKQAELENFRKRIERERTETVKYAAVDVVKELLPILDNLERAIEAANKGGNATPDQLIQGVEIVFRQFRDTLLKQGLEEVKAKNQPFDPHVHEAVGRVSSKDHEDGIVVEVFQKGYRFRERLLRPAMVTVSQSDGGATDASSSTD